MAIIPPETPIRPCWMTDQEYRKLLLAEQRLLRDFEKSATPGAFFAKWFRSVWR